MHKGYLQFKKIICTYIQVSREFERLYLYFEIGKLSPSSEWTSKERIKKSPEGVVKPFISFLATLFLFILGKAGRFQLVIVRVETAFSKRIAK
jgi:hypothetical protein